MSNEPNWIKCYMTLADHLLQYKDNRQGLLKILEEVYEVLNLKNPFMEDGQLLEDICPFTVFGAFNKGITDENRRKLISAIAEKIGVQVEMPTDFIGIPLLNNLKAWFFRFKEKRNSADIPNLWNLFEIAIRYADMPTEGNKAAFSDQYNRVIKQSSIKWNITMGLYWIRPCMYLNLDKNNRAYLLSNHFPLREHIRNISKLNQVPNAHTYLELIALCKEAFALDNIVFHDFPALSIIAWKTPVEGIKQSKAEFAKWFGPLVEALKELGGSAKPEEARTQIIKDQELDSTTLNEVRGKNDTNKFNNEVAWARQYLVYAELIDNSERGIWKLTDKAYEVQFTSEYILDILREGRKIGQKVDVTEEENGIVAEPLADYIQDKRYEVYTEEEFLEEVFMSEDSYRTLAHLLRNKKNIILQGAPGVGKTFAAKRLAYALMGVKDNSRVAMIQFHQSYSYEDFVMGYRPTETGFRLEEGPFYKFCKCAEEDLQNDYFFIIDEINRGNMSKIFGELLMLIEKDKRGESIQLIYGNKLFTVPPNVYIIGMMNTADRSLAMIDYALRRRFAFFELDPAFENEGFEQVMSVADNVKFNKLVQVVKHLNTCIVADEALGNGFRIGHSYLCVQNSVKDEWVKAVAEYELIPLLQEYWFDELDKVNEWSRKLRGVLND